MTSRFLLLAVAALAIGCGGSSPTSPSATTGPRTLYVSPSGSNSNNGSMSSPWGTLHYAVAQLRPGDTLYLRGGNYEGGENTIDSQSISVPSGTSWSNAITIAGAPGELVTLRPPDGLEAIRLTIGAPHYLIFQDFVVDMNLQVRSSDESAPNGIFVSYGAHHNRFQRLEVKNNTITGISFADENEAALSPSNEVLNCSIHDNGRYDGINKGYGAYVFSSDNLFEGNEIYNNGGYGLHFYSNHGPLNVSRNIIRRNRIHDNGTHGGTNYGVVVAWGDSNQVYDNTIYGNTGGVLVYTNSSGAQVYNNTIYGNSVAGILVQYATGTTIRDNNVYGNGEDIVDLGDGTILTNNSIARLGALRLRRR